MKQKDYQIAKNKKVLYEGNNAFKAVQTFYATIDANLHVKGKIQTAVFNHIVAIQERLN